MKWNPGECSPGDMIRVKLGSIYHYGIFVSEDEVIAFGMPPVREYADDPRRLTVCSTDIDVFSCGNIVEVGEYDRSELKKKKSPGSVISAARSRMGEGGYNLIHNNCEHFANECVFGEKKSLQEEEARRKWMSRPVCDVYLARTMEEMPASETGRIVSCAERESEITGTKNDGLRMARYSDWKLLELAAERSLAVDISKETFIKTPQGKWTCGSFEFSLTHAGGFVAAAVSGRPVGVDMEAVDEFESKRGGSAAEGIRKRFFTFGEKKIYPESTEGFLCCWTRKEAEFKKKGKGNFHPLLIDTSKKSGMTRTIVPRTDPRIILSVSSESAGSLRLFMSDYSGSEICGFSEID
jgi:hypothetical protein